MMGHRPWLPIDLLFSLQEHYQQPKESTNTSKHYMDDSDKQLNLHVSLLIKKQHNINVSMTVEQESQNSAMEIRC